MAPESELVRRIAPLAIPVAIVAFAAGRLIGGTDAGWSAAIAIAVVTLNFVAHGWSLALAAQISPMLLYAVGLGGFIVRLGVIVAVIALLQQTEWFSIGTFIVALVPCTVALLVVEMKMLAGRMQADLWTVPSGPPGMPR
jgi:hypothetical protein